MKNLVLYINSYYKQQAENKTQICNGLRIVKKHEIIIKILHELIQFEAIWNPKSSEVMLIFTTVVPFGPIKGQDFTVIWSISHLAQYGLMCLAWMLMWHKLVVLVDMKFNPLQASDKFHIDKYAYIN